MHPLSRRLLQGALLFSTLCLAALAAERTKITVLSTTDLHSHVAPVDYFTNKPSQDGLAKIATLIAQERKAAPKALLLDIGDTIQGTPLGYFHARKHPEPIDPTIAVMNHLGFTSMTVGNHEFNFGRPTLHKAQGEAKFPWLSANIVRKADQSPLFTPYIIREVDGVRIAILGITTAGIPYWENAETIADLDFLSPTETAARYVRLLREQEHADIVIAAMHTGIEEDLSSGIKPPGQIERENAALDIANNVPGIDLILMGHTHRMIDPLVVNGVLVAQAGYWGNRLVAAELYVERAAPGQPWKLLAKSAHNLNVTEAVQPDPEVMKIVEPYHVETQAWLDKPIGHSADALVGTLAREEDSALLDLIHRVQLEAGKADISFAASFNPSARIPKGDVSVRNIYSLYTYENTLCVVELTGAQVKEALEHAARYYLPWEEGKSIAQLANPRIPGYNFDTAEGVSYQIDLRRPIGERVINLSRDGKPLDPAAKFRVAVNNYRQNGGGGYLMFRKAPVLQRISTEVRDLIIDWVERHSEIPATPSANWSFVK
jgi:2',3'-cyclic-nucleotide 2'-phosphodiesterase/3'-nucleotidase